MRTPWQIATLEKVTAVCHGKVHQQRSHGLV